VIWLDLYVFSSLHQSLLFSQKYKKYSFLKARKIDQRNKAILSIVPGLRLKTIKLTGLTSFGK
jgi:hypothetical protein